MNFFKRAMATLTGAGERSGYDAGKEAVQSAERAVNAQLSEDEKRKAFERAAREAQEGEVDQEQLDEAMRKQSGLE